MAEPENVCEEAQVESDKIKAEANEQFKSERYDKAIELYSKVNSYQEMTLVISPAFNFFSGEPF